MGFLQLCGVCSCLTGRDPELAEKTQVATLRKASCAPQLGGCMLSTDSKAPSLRWVLVTLLQTVG